MLLFFVILSFSFTLAVLPTVIALAWRIGAVDRPGEWRRMHVRRIPRAGGLAIFSSFALACLAMGQPSHALACAVGGGFLLLLVGLADDILGLRAVSKLFFQFAVVVACVVGEGSLSGARLALGVLWVLTLANAHNFIDGLDGLFAGTATVECLLLALTLGLLGAGEGIAPTLILSAACAGFFCYNRHPARIFAGDCGSVTVGFLLGMLSLPLLGDPTLSPSLLSPFFLFAYPLTDLCTAVLRRILRGRSPFSADRAHLHHRLVDAGLSQPQCVMVLHVISAALGLIGVLLISPRTLPLASLACMATAWLLIGIRHFITDFA